jgi:hypothetical protein
MLEPIILLLEMQQQKTGITIAGLSSSNSNIYFADGTSGDAAYRGIIRYTHLNDNFSFWTAGQRRVDIDSSGRLLVGTSSARSNFFNTASSAPQQLQVEGTTGNTCSLSSICSVADTSGGRLLLAHQRSGAVGGNTILNSGDQAGYITFQGNDGGEFVECASIEAQVDGTPGANDMPGRLVFSTTADGASSATERLRITSAGLVGIGTSAPAELMQLRGSGATKLLLSSADNTTDRGIYFGTSDNTVLGYIKQEYSTGTFEISSGSGAYSSGIGFRTGGVANRVVIDSSGRVGIGTTSPGTPLHIASQYPSIRLQSNTGSYQQRSTVGQFDNIMYIECDNDNAVASSAIAFTVDSTERMRIDSSGNVGIGTTSPGATSGARLHVHGSTENSTLAEFGTFNLGRGLLIGTAADGAVNDVYVTYTAQLANYGGHIWKVGSNELARLTKDGQLLVGTSSGRAVGFTSLQAPVQVETTTAAAYTAVNNTNDANGCYVSIAKTRGTSAGAVTAVQNNDELGAIRISGSDGTGFVVGAQIIAAVDGTPGTNDLPTRLMFSTTADGASSPTERMRINAGGNFLINQTTTDDPAGTNTQGLAFGSAGWISNCRDGATPVLIGRKGSDGTLVEFFQDGTVEGSISVSGTTVSYNGAHLSRWSQLPSGAERTEILRGTVLSNIDEMCEWTDEENEQLNRMKVSDVEGDKNVSGVFQAWDDDDDTYTNDFYCAMTGDFIIRIGAGVTVERGDLLMSAGDGTAKPQDDDIIRSKTIAKVTSTNVSCTYDDGSYCVPCVLMAC